MDWPTIVNWSQSISLQSINQLYSNKINSGAHENLELPYQGTAHVQEVNNLVEKRLTHTLIDKFEPITFQVTDVVVWMMLENFNLFNHSLVTFSLIILNKSSDSQWSSGLPKSYESLRSKHYFFKQFPCPLPLINTSDNPNQED